MNDNVKEFAELLAKLDETQKQRIYNYLMFIKGMDDTQRATYEELERLAAAAYNGDTVKIFPVMEYAIPKIRTGEAAADIWNQYQQEGGGHK